MNKQKWLIAGLSLVMAATLGVGISACGGKPHTHTYDTWDYNETQHWKYCDEHGTDKSNIDETTKANHDFSNGDCECGAKKPASEHTHTYTKWEYDATQHWKVCPDDNAVDPAGKSDHVFVAGKCECGAKTTVPTEELSVYVCGNLFTNNFKNFSKKPEDMFKMTYDKATDTWSVTVYLTYGDAFRVYVAETEKVYPNNHDVTLSANMFPPRPVGDYIISWVTNSNEVTYTLAPHTHSYTKWAYSGTEHWKICPTDNEIDETTRAPHDFSKGKVCECGYEQAEIPACERHTYDTENKCTVCGRTLQFTPDLTFAPVDGGYALTGYSGTESLTELVAPYAYEGQPVVEVAEKAFNDKTKYVLLESVVLQDGVKVVRNSAFASLPALARIDLGRGIETIESSALPSNLSEITVGKNLNSVASSIGGKIAKEHFLGTFEDFLKIEHANLLSAEGTLDFDGTPLPDDVSLPAALTRIPAYAFNYTGIKTITIPTTVTELGDYAFARCSQLTTVDLSSLKLTEIPKQCFSYFGNAESQVKLPNGLLTIGASAFASAKFTTISIPSTVTSVGNKAFYQTMCTNIILPDNVEELGQDVFGASTALRSITLPRNLKKLTTGERTNMTYGTFEGCTALESITIPASVTDVDHHAFYNCTALQTVTFEAGCSVSVIKTSTFEGCKALTTVIAPTGLAEVQYCAFMGAGKLTTLTNFENVMEWGQKVFNGSLIEEIDMSNWKATELGDWMFAHCTELYAVQLPSGLKSFGTKVFNSCESLIMLTIPASVESLGLDPFAGAPITQLTFEEPNGWYVYSSGKQVAALDLSTPLKAAAQILKYTGTPNKSSGYEFKRATV